MVKDKEKNKNDSDEIYFVKEVTSYGSPEVGRCHIEVPKDKRQTFPKGTPVKITKL